MATMNETSQIATPSGSSPDAVGARPYWVYRFAAWVGIVAGIVFIAAVIFFSGAKIGHHGGWAGHHHHHHHHHAMMHPVPQQLPAPR